MIHPGTGHSVIPVQRSARRCATTGGRFLLIAVILQDAALGLGDVTDDVTLRKGNRSAPLARVSDR